MREMIVPVVTTVLYYKKTAVTATLTRVWSPASYGKKIDI